MRLALVLATVGCGRLGFDAQPTEVRDAPVDVVIDSTCGAVETFDVDCPEGYAGTITEMHTFVCPPGMWSDPVVVGMNCALSSYTWQTQMPPVGTFPAPQGVLLGKACTTPGAMMPCYSPLGSSLFYHYDSCTCE